MVESIVAWEAHALPRKRSIVARFALYLALALCAAGQASAHEFWIAPKAGKIALGEAIVADLMVGVMLRGTRYPYLPEYITRFDVTVQGQAEAVVGLPGDIPAMRHPTTRAGLHVIVHRTVPFRTTYEDWTLFQRYVAEEGFPEIEAQHLARGLPTTGFSERYTRYVKALVQVGPAQPGQLDFRTGLPFELVAEANPYGAAAASLPVRLFWQSGPARNVQVSVLRDSRVVERQVLRTDQEGRVHITLGSGTYLLSAVRIDPVENAPVVWSSHWAALSLVIGP